MHLVPMATGRGLELETTKEGLPEAAQPQDTGLGFLSGVMGSSLAFLKEGPKTQDVWLHQSWRAHPW